MLELSPAITRQYIDAVAVFDALAEAAEEAAQVRGGMYWHTGSRRSLRKHAVRVMQQMPIIAQRNQQLFQRNLKKAVKPLVVALDAGVHNPAASVGGAHHAPTPIAKSSLVNRAMPAAK
jgi:hypothetical protein